MCLQGLFVLQGTLNFHEDVFSTWGGGTKGWIYEVKKVLENEGYLCSDTLM